MRDINDTFVYLGICALVAITIVVGGSLCVEIYKYLCEMVGLRPESAIVFAVIATVSCIYFVKHITKVED